MDYDSQLKTRLIFFFEVHSLQNLSNDVSACDVYHVMKDFHVSNCQAWIVKACDCTRIHPYTSRMPMPKTLYGMLPHFLIIHSFSTILLTFFHWTHEMF